MNDAPGCDSSPLPHHNHPVALAPYTPAIACATCGGTAHVLARWTPAPGLDPDLRKYRCILSHDTYRPFRRHPKTKPAHGPLFDPGSGP